MNGSKARIVSCDRCGERAELVDGEVLYGNPCHRDKFFYRCAPCGVYVGCHPGTTAPLGTLADAETRRARNRAHAVFDRLWKSGQMRRREAYRLMQKIMNLPEREAHIAKFTAAQCELLIDALLEIQSWESTLPAPVLETQTELRA